MKICITGKKGSGKSTFIEIAKKNNLSTYRADDFINSIYEHNRIGYNFVLETFGINFIQDNKVNRKKLNELIFNDDNAFEKLSVFTMNEIKKWVISIKDNLAIIELAIYLNNSNYFRDIFDKIVLIFTDEKIIEKRIVKKENHISSRLNIKKRELFDDVIYNNESIEEFEKNILFFLSLICL